MIVLRGMKMRMKMNQCTLFYSTLLVRTELCTSELPTIGSCVVAPNALGLAVKAEATSWLPPKRAKRAYDSFTMVNRQTDDDDGCSQSMYWTASIAMEYLASLSRAFFAVEVRYRCTSLLFAPTYEVGTYRGRTAVGHCERNSGQREVCVTPIRMMML